MPNPRDKVINVLEMIDSSMVGGGQKHLHSLIQGLDKQKFNISVVVSDDGPLYKILQNEGITVFCTDIRKNFNPFTLLRLYKILKVNKIDVIHTHGTVAGVWGRLAASLARTPVIIYTLHGIHYLNSHNRIFKQIFILIDQILAKFSDKIICVASSDQEKGYRYRLFEKGKSIVIYNGVDINYFKPRRNLATLRKEFDIKAKDPVIGIVARLHVQKGYHYFFDTINLIKKKYPNIKALVIGDGPQLSELREKVRQLHLTENVIFAGTRDDIPELLSMMNVFVLASLWEGMPLTVLEAMACKKPIVATNVDGVSESLTDGETGFLVPSQDPAALADKIIYLLENKDVGKKLGERARKVLVKKFPIEKMVRETSNLYTQLYFDRTAIHWRYDNIRFIIEKKAAAGNGPDPASLLKNHNIICIASANWDAPLWTNSQHVMSRLSPNNKILFVESLGLRRPTFRKDFARIAHRFVNWLRGTKKINDNLFVYSPLIIPLHAFRFIRKLNYLILRQSLTHQVKKLHFDDPILWTFLPTSSDLLGLLGEKLAIYHCVDEYTANPGVPKDVIDTMEKQLLNNANIVYTTSKNLYDTKKMFNENTYYMPNVADAEHFIQATFPETLLPIELSEIPTPRIGFIGALSGYKVNFDLIEEVAHAHPEWSIVMVGPVWSGDPDTNTATLEKYGNLHLLGTQPYERLPNFLKGFDVCIIPFHLNETTVSVFPLKFFEYMAAGKPIVLTNLPSVHEYRNYCHIAKNSDEFIQYIEEALLEKDAVLVEKRIKLAKIHTWQARILEMTNIINHKLEEGIPVRVPSLKKRRKRIGIDVRKINDFGIGTHIQNIVKNLSYIDTEHDYLLFHHLSEIDHLEIENENFFHIVDRSPKYSLREHLSLPIKMKQYDLDLYHSPHYVLPLLHNCPTIVTIHDVIHLLFPQYLPSRMAHLYAKMMMFSSTKSALKVITVSQSSKRDIVRYLKIAPDKIKVIHNAVSDIFKPMASSKTRAPLKEHFGLSGDYLLYVGNLMPHKNLKRLIYAFYRLIRKMKLDMQLVIVGEGIPHYRELKTLAHDLGLKNNVIFLGFISKEWLPILYNAAKVFVFPSLYEGFGLPPLEAMACGTPVVTSNTSSLPEVVSDAGLLIDPYNIDELIEAMERCINDQKLIDELVEKGLQRVKLFSWERTAERTLEIYQEILERV
ncbi:glycosyltransferase [candidate division CSSED10-310 bacterium]|uniref:Glycosyltransferase n=1 Tax=candidate division CSSED10-310 bacterium TaxID=2855610 RepID=A0ABV6YU54_UNCC1